MRGSVLAGLAAGSLGVFGTAGFASAAAPCGATGTVGGSGTTLTCTYSTATVSDGFTVPEGVKSIDVTAVGASGGNGADTTSPPGQGASVEDLAVPVTAGQVLGVVVGTPGGGGGLLSSGGTPGMPGGGAGGDYPPPTAPPGGEGGGGGGGYSGVFDPADSPLVLAGGGGGAGATTGAAGGAGDTGQGGASGTNGSGSVGGGGGSTTGGGGSGGQGGFPAGGAGTAGSFLQGGQGGDADTNGGGGGGGGGYYGGGGGGGARNGAGGGGGSSFGITGLANEVNTSAAASVTISYTVNPPPTCQPVTVSTGQGQSVSVPLSCIDATGAGLTYAVAAGPSHGTLGVIDQSTGTVTYTPASGFAGSDSFTYDATSSNGSAQVQTVSITVTAIPNRADVSVSIAGPSRAAPGSTLTETITVANAGPAAATNVITGLVIPGGLTVTNTNGGRAARSLINWTAPSVAAHGTVTYTATFTIARGAHGRLTFLVGSASTQVPDPRYLNNAAATVVTVN